MGDEDFKKAFSPKIAVEEFVTALMILMLTKTESLQVDKRLKNIVARLMFTAKTRTTSCLSLHHS